MLTDRGDLVLDPFAGSCVTGEVAERLARTMLAEIHGWFTEGFDTRRSQGRKGVAGAVKRTQLKNPSLNHDRVPPMRSGKGHFVGRTHRPELRQQQEIV